MICLISGQHLWLHQQLLNIVLG